MNAFMLRRIVSATAVTALVVGGATACGSSAKDSYGLSDPGTITAGITTGDYPFVYADSTGKPVGFLVDLNDRIAKAMGLKIVYKTTTVQAGLPALTSGQYDMMSVGLVATPERAKSVGFTKSIFWGQNVVVVPASSSAKSVSDFSGKRVGAGANSNQADFVQKQMTSSHFISEATDSAGVSQLLAGNLDAIVLGSTHVGQIFDQHPGKLKVALTAAQANPGAEAVNKKLTKFTAAYNTELAKLVNDGTFLKLYQQYFKDLPFPTKMYQIWPVIEKQVAQQG